MARMKVRWVVFGGLLAWGCFGDDPFTNERVGDQQDTLQKGRVGAMNGDTNYCDWTANPCVSGEGDCDKDSQCTGGAVCGVDNGPAFGFPELYDFCVPPHCRNKIKDADETHVDCGGADCGSNCAYLCAGLPANGSTGHCTLDCPCAASNGDCANDSAKCQAGLTCSVNVGSKYGLAATVDVCESAHCSNGIQDADEDGVDCGGADCVSCTTPSLGAAAYGGATDDSGRSVAVGADGSIILAGRFTTTADFGGGALTTGGGSATASDVFVAKYNAAGVHQWSKRFGAEFSDGSFDVAVSVNASGHVVLVGNYAGTVDFGGGAVASDSGSYDAFIVKLDAAGNYLWGTRYGGPGLDRFDDVAFDRDGTVLVVGSFKGTSSFGGAALTSAGDYDVVAVKYNGSTGAHVWSRAFGSITGDVGTGIAVDYNHDVIIAGSFGDTVTFGSNTPIVSAGAADIFVAKLARTTGEPIWSRGYGGTGQDTATAVAVDLSLRPVVVGQFRRTLDFGGGAITAVGTTDKTDAFTLALDAAGAYRWSRQFGGTDHDQALGVTVNSAGEAAVTGVLRGTVDNFAADGSSTMSAGLTDAFVIRYGAASGTTVSSVRYGGTGDDAGLGIFFFSGRSYVTGSFEGAVEFGSTNLNSVGGTDVFWTKLAF